MKIIELTKPVPAGNFIRYFLEPEGGNAIPRKERFAFEHLKNKVVKESLGGQRPSEKDREAQIELGELMEKAGAKTQLRVTYGTAF